MLHKINLKRDKILLDENLTANYISNAEGKLLFCNKAFVEMFGFRSKEEAMNTNVSELYKSTAERIAFLDIIRRNKKVEMYEADLVKKDKSVITVLENVVGEFSQSGQLNQLKGYMFDITKWKKTQDELFHLTKLYSVLSSINGAIAKIKDQQKLFDEVCRIAVEVGKFRASSLYIINVKDRSFNRAASCGIEENYFNELKRTFQKHPAFRELIYNNILSSDYIIFNDIVKDKNFRHISKFALANNFRSLIVLPVKMLEETIGSLQFYSDVVEGFKENEINLFKELAGNISFAIGNFVREKQRIHSEEALKESREMYHQVIENASELIMLTDHNGNFTYANHAALKASGYTFDEMTSFNYIHLVCKDYKRKVTAFYINQLKSKQIESTLQFPYYTKTGEVRWLEQNVRLLLKENQVAGFQVIARDITDRKIAEEKLKLKTNELDGYFNRSLDLLCISDTSGNFLRLNPEWEKVLGYKTDELVGKSFMDFVHHDDYANTVDAITTLSGQKEVINFVNRFRTKEGSYRWIEWRSNPKGNIIYAAARDITETRLANEALMEREFLLSEAARTAQFGVWDYDLISGKLNWTEQTFKCFGVDPENFIPTTHTFVNLIHSDDRSLMSEWINELLQNGTAKDLVFRTLASDNSIRYLYGTGKAVMGEDGKPIRSIGTVQDITARKHAQEELIKLNRAIEQSSVSVIITDHNGNIEYVNPFFSEQTGYTFEEVKGMNPRILRSHVYDKAFYESLWNTILNGKQWRGEMLNKKKNNETYWSNAVISPIINHNGIITHFVAIEEDVTEKKKILDELISAKEKAEEINRVKSSFFANMSHELRTPFVGILGFSEILSENLKDHKDREMAAGIYKSSKRLMETLNSILDISRIETNKQNVRFSSVNLPEIIRESANRFMKAAFEKGLSFELLLPKNSVSINSDSDLLSKIFNNLISNAVKYTDNGAVTIRVSLDEIVDRRYYKVDIIDSGIGITDEHRDLVFEPFRQVSEGFSRRFEGTGLGLSITKKFVELLNGSISFQSASECGSVFSVVFPIDSVVPYVQRK